MFSAEILARMLNVIQNSEFNTCNDELLLHSKTEDQAHPMHLHSLNWIFYGLFLFTCIFYSIQLCCKRAEFLNRLNHDK